MSEEIKTITKITSDKGCQSHRKRNFENWLNDTKEGRHKSGFTLPYSIKEEPLAKLG